MFKKLLMIAWVGLVGLTVSCKGPQGDVGPQGEQGATGATGATGPAGQDGEGSGGGSVIAFMGELETDSTGNAFFGADDFFDGATAVQIESVEKGSFQVFVKDDGAYFPIPGFVLFSDEAISYGYYYAVEGNGLYFQLFRTSAATKPQRTFEEIRVLYIPAINASGRSSVNWKNYEEATTALGLTETDVRKVTAKRPSKAISFKN